MALIVATIGTFFFKDFKTAMGVLFGGLGLSGIVSATQNMSNNGTLTQAVNTVSNNASTAVSSAAATVGLSTGPATTNNTPTNDLQKDLREKVEVSGIATEIDKLAASHNSYKGKLDDYLTFIEKDNFKNLTLDKLFPKDKKKSIFYDGYGSDLPTDSKLSDMQLKEVARLYMTGSKSGTKKEKDVQSLEDSFLSLHNIDKTKLDSIKLSDILVSIHTKLAN